VVKRLDMTAAGEAADNPGHRVSRTGLIMRYIQEGLSRDGSGKAKKTSK
jgi:hypothetical protein